MSALTRLQAYLSNMRKLPVWTYPQFAQQIPIDLLGVFAGTTAGTSTVVIPPTWNVPPNTTYVAGDKVLYLTVVYVCVLGHSIPVRTPPNATYWAVSTNSRYPVGPGNSNGEFYLVTDVSPPQTFVWYVNTWYPLATSSGGGGGSAYVLPPATVSVLGGVIVGTGLAVDGLGTLSATATGTVTGVTATAPVASSGGAAPVISMAAATAIANGYMTSTYAAKLDGIATGANLYVLPIAAAGSLGGIRVGTNLSIDGSGILSATYTYTLPIAAAGSLGGIRVGTNLSIDGSGILSGTVSAYTLPIASAGSLGGIRVGSGLSIDGSGILSATPGGISAATTAVLGGVLLTVTDQVSASPVIPNRDANGSMTVTGNMADGASAIGVILNNAIALTNVTSKIVSFRNATVEKAYIGYDGQLGLIVTNTDYTNTAGAGSHIYMSNPSATGQNVVTSYINGTLRAKWRTDYAGNLSWVANGGSHSFYTGGDFPTGTAKLTILDSGLIGVGPAAGTPTYQLEVVDEVLVTNRGMAVSQHNTGVHGAAFSFLKTRGTRASPTAVANGDYGGFFANKFRDTASANVTTGGFGFRVNGTVGSNSVPTDMFFYTNAAQTGDPYSDGTVRMILGSTGLFGLNTTTLTTAGISMISKMADGAAAIGTILDTSTAWANVGAKLVSVRNNAVEKFWLDKDGNVGSMGGYWGTSFQDRTGANPLRLLGNMADSGTAVGVSIDSAVAYTVAGSKLLSIRNNAVEKFYVDKDGNAFAAASQVWTQATLNKGVTISAPNLCGFLDRTSSTLSFVDGTLTLTITPTSGTFDIWTNNTKWSKGVCTKAIANTVGEHFLYFDSTGTLVESVSPWSITSDQTAPAALVYWDGAKGALLDERHSAYRNRSTHAYLHSTRGTAYDNGYTGTFTDTTLSIADGAVWDEDIKIQAGSTQTSARVFYRKPGGTEMTWDVLTTPYKDTAGTLEWDNAGTLTAVATTGGGRYITNWIYATTDLVYPIYVVVSQAEYANLTAARAALQPTFPNLTIREWKLIYSVVYRNIAGTATYVESVDYRTVSTLPGASVTSLPASSVTLTPVTGITSTNVQGAFAEVLPLAGGILTGGLTGTTGSFTGQLTSNSSNVVTVLSYASAGTAGSIKVGSGLAIDGSGVLSATGTAASAATTAAMGVVLLTVTDQVPAGPIVPNRSANGSMTVTGNYADGAAAVGVILDNAITLANAGAKLLSVQNNTVEKFYITKDGEAWANGVHLGAGGGGGGTAAVASGTVTAGHGVYYNGSGTVAHADSATLTSDMAVVGVCSIGNTTGLAVTFVQSGLLTGVLSGATAGAIFYSGSAGAPTLFASVPAGGRLVQLGVAATATDLLVQVIDMGRRA